MAFGVREVATVSGYREEALQDIVGCGKLAGACP